MGITVLSPHDGQPVKVRDQDVGRAVRDREKRIFYVLPRSDGSGHYGALTRAGGEKDERRAIELEEKVARQQAHAKNTLTQSSGSQSPPQAHDATGKRRSRAGRKILILMILLLAAAAATGYYFREQIRAYVESLQSARPLPRLVIIYTVPDVSLLITHPSPKSYPSGKFL